MVTIIDFNDSFTFNIGAILASMGIEHKIIAHTQLDQLEVQSGVYLLGPGPGHPNQYPKAIQFINENLGRADLFFMGLCLGHQLLMLANGAKIVKCKSPIHGQVEKLKIPNWSGIFSRTVFGKKAYVQRYNSLCVKSVASHIKTVKNSSGEIMLATAPGLYSCQFHPESVGTSCPKSFFYAIEYFLYNKNDEKGNEARRPLR
ncbi:class I glutamine amidotransferase [Bacteriovorax sp. BSW11_IV]|uniref:aminodeoxychorismate/anthranilate synthase component II n=1 Tax=Bacteriovorax sp. BSW11_IV TaxID=1353529 RepID=UPI00038A31F4|nr:aminodeoxychorismate/anthranilate synthase component II [Bacteriovorax sp. BSW11_IV]EQC49488.1 class I glutamine amidotransferase [Bacteriovorax sp. BSW11_IV]